MALQRASSSTRETHHKPMTRKWWINALIFQKTLLPLLQFENIPCYPARKHNGENVEKTHRKPKEKHALVIHKTQKNDGENPRTNIPLLSRKPSKMMEKTTWKIYTAYAGALRPQADAPRRLGAGALRPQADATRRHPNILDWWMAWVGMLNKIYPSILDI